MAYENIQIGSANLTVGLDGSSFFTMDHTQAKLIEKNASGGVIFSYFLSVFVTEVYSLEFDGYYFWSLERSGGSGFTVRKWEIGATDLVSIVQQFVFVSDAVDSYDTYAMALESYTDSLSTTGTAGTSSFDVTDGTVIEIGDDIVIGPSTHAGFEGDFSKTTVINKVGSTITVSPVLSSSFNSSDPLSFSRNFYIFSDTSQGSETGGLYKFASDNGAVQALDMGNLYNTVRAATFFKGNVMFVRAGEIIWLDPDSVSVFKSQAIDNMQADRGSYQETFDLAGFSNSIYRLEQTHVSYNGTTEVWETENWSPQYNFNTSGTVPEVYFVALKADPPILHKSVAGLAVEDTKSNVKVIVLDQFRTPVFNRVVDFSTTAGSVVPPQDTTDADGIAETVYTSDTSVGQVTVTADVT
jgi:hypothetical protein